jgi:hypothetical protein
MKRIIISFVVFLIVVSTALILRHQRTRVPSSLDPALDTGFVTLEDGLKSDVSKKNVKKKILRDLAWSFPDKDSHSMSFQFQNFIIKTTQTENEFCANYPQVLIILEAPELSYSGDHPEITTQANCVVRDDKSYLRADLTLLFDSDELKKVKSESGKIDSIVRIKNWDTEVPDKWRVKQILFFEKNNKQSDLIDLTKYEILSVVGHSLEFNVPIEKQ